MFKNIKLYLCWFVYYLIYDFIITILNIKIYGGNMMDSINSRISKYSLVDFLFYGTQTTSYHLWFLVALIWSTGILYAFFRINKLKLLLFFSFLMNILGQFGQGYYSIWPQHGDFRTRDALFFGLFYLSFGFFISMNNHILESNRIKLKRNTF